MLLLTFDLFEQKFRHLRNKMFYLIFVEFWESDFTEINFRDKKDFTVRLLKCKIWHESEFHVPFFFKLHHFCLNLRGSA